MPTGGTVTITARRALSQSAPAVLIHVSDNGPGIPSLALGRIFEPGFSSKNNGSVCGLGLAIVRQLVEASGGEVRVASTRRPRHPPAVAPPSSSASPPAHRHPKSAKAYFRNWSGGKRRPKIRRNTTAYTQPMGNQTAAKIARPHPR